jgi:DNA invertase Pin-like site-specific DNA recombinase
VLTVWKLDRLGQSLPHLVGVLETLKGQGVGFRSLTEAIDTESANVAKHEVEHQTVGYILSNVSTFFNDPASLLL